MTLHFPRRALLAAPFAAPAVVAAQGAWKPGRAVTMIVPFAAGSGTDTVSRLLASLLEQDWGVQIVIDNRPARTAPSLRSRRRARRLTAIR